MRTCKLSRRRDANAGFTLLELGIVLAVIGILSAILVPSFTGIVERARQTAAQQNCRLYAEQFAFYLFDEAGEGELGDYIFVSGNYAFCVENGAFREADYAAKDGKLLSGDGEPIEGSNKEAGVSLVTDLPDELTQDLVTVYVRTDGEADDAEGPSSAEEPDGQEQVTGEAARKAALDACEKLLNAIMSTYQFQAGTIFACGNYAFEYKNGILADSALVAENGELKEIPSGMKKFETGSDGTGVTIYVKDAWLESRRG